MHYTLSELTTIIFNMELTHLVGSVGGHHLLIVVLILATEGWKKHVQTGPITLSDVAGRLAIFSNTIWFFY